MCQGVSSDVTLNAGMPGIINLAVISGQQNP
jgi:hypothetical protein